MYCGLNMYFFISLNSDTMVRYVYVVDFIKDFVVNGSGHVLSRDDLFVSEGLNESYQQTNNQDKFHDVDV